MLFLIIKWIHVLSAITAVGANITYGMWIGRVPKDPKILPFVLHNIKTIDDWIANPCYGLLLFTGLAMAFIVPITLTTPWLLTALTLYVIATIIGMAGFVPIFKKQIRLLEREGIDSPNYKAAEKQGRVPGIVTGVVVIAITFLMVVKPALWA